MNCTSLALQKNQKVPDILHTLQGYSIEGPWLHLHQIVQMSDDIEDPLKMQLKTKNKKHISVIKKGKEIKTGKERSRIHKVTIKLLYIKSFKRGFQC